MHGRIYSCVLQTTDHAPSRSKKIRSKETPRINSEVRHKCIYIEQNPGNPKVLWKTKNNSMHRKEKNCSVQCIKSEISNEVLSEPGKIAEYLNNYFTNVGPNLAKKINSSNDVLNDYYLWSRFPN